jgi:hypothetical protein
MSINVARRLRPHLFHGFKRSQPLRSLSRTALLADVKDGKSVTNDYEKRVKQLEAYKPLAECYPRLPSGPFDPQAPLLQIDLQEFRRCYHRIEPGDTVKNESKYKSWGVHEPLHVHGMLHPLIIP